jgi:hypothetical protein
MALPRAAHGKVVFCRESLTAKRYFAVRFFSGSQQNELCINSIQILKKQINSNKKTFNYKVSLLLNMNNFY